MALNVDAEKSTTAQRSLPNGRPDTLSPEEGSPISGSTQTKSSSSQNGVSSTPSVLNPRSCHTCRRRKVKCDKNYPCSNCTRASTECVFPGPGRAPRRPKQPKEKVASERETELLKRLRRLEGVVEELSGQVEIEHQRASPQSNYKTLANSGKEWSSTSAELSPSSEDKSSFIKAKGLKEGTGDPGTWLNRMYGLGEGPPRGETMLRSPEVAKVVVEDGKSRYISNEFWMRLNMEVADMIELADDDYHSDGSPSGDEDTPDPSSAEVDLEEDHQGFILGYSSSTIDLKTLHPPPSQVPFYWQTYIENIDPLVKIIHIPSMAKIVKDMQDNSGSLSRSTEALMFSIYLSVIISMTPEEVKTSLNADKSQLLKRYRFATEQALARAGFLTTSEIVTLQAFVLFLVCIRRHDDSKIVWSLTGLLIRLSQGLGLHRDGVSMNLSVFETEMRRRLWWQVRALDLRSSEDLGTDPSILTSLSSLDSFTDTRLPMNYNDTDFDVDSETWPEPRIGLSDMTFCLIRYEICTMSMKLQYTTPTGPDSAASRARTLTEKEQMIQDLSAHLEDTYLKYCKDAGPLYWVAATVARLILSKMTLIVYGFRDPNAVDQLPQATKDRLLVSSVEIMEYCQVLQTESSTKKWGWLFHTYVQWHAIAYILKAVCTQPPSEVIERGWRSVDKVFSSWSAALNKSQKNSQLWTPIRKLMIKASRKRKADLELAKRGVQVGNPTINAHSSSPADYPSLGGITDNFNPSLPESTFQDPTIWNAGFGYQPTMNDINFFANQAQTAQMNQLSQDTTPLTNGFVSTSPWILDDSALSAMDLNIDMDMSGMDADVNNIDWTGWDDAVRNFGLQSDQDSTNQGRPGPNLNGMGTWW